MNSITSLLLLAAFAAGMPEPFGGGVWVVGEARDALADQVSAFLQSHHEWAVEEADAVAAVVSAESTVANVDPSLILAVMEVESGFEAAAVSPKGASGLLQIRAETAAEVISRHGLKDEDPGLLNVRAAIRYLGSLQDRFRSRDLALMAYNVGPGRVFEAIRKHELAELAWYPRKVVKAERRLKAVLDAAPVWEASGE